MDQKKRKIKCEIWKDIPNYEGLYQVSNMGNVKSISHYAKNNVNGGLRLTKGIILSQYKMPNGYLQVQLSKNKIREKKYVHRLVAEIFLTNDENLSDVNHIDGNKENNSVENLEWCSHKENQIHMVKIGLTKKAQSVICEETGIKYSSLSEAERETGISRKAIKKSCENGNKYGGYHWRLDV